MRRLSSTGIAILLGALLAVFVATPAAAAGHQPDGWVRYYQYHSGFGGNIVAPTAWVGQNIYNLSGTGQVAKRTTSGTYETGSYFEFQVFIQNDGSADRFKVHATGQGSTFKYLHGTTNITSAVVAGTYQTPSLGSGDTYTLKVRVRIATGARLITLTSVANSTKKDAVKVKVTYSSCGC